MNIARMILTLTVASSTSIAIAQAESTPQYPEMPHFDVVDTNKDGFLGIDEARKVFGDLLIEDVDGDGIVSKGEAEAAIPGLRYTNDTHEDNELRVGPADYALMAEQFAHRVIEEETDH